MWDGTCEFMYVLCIWFCHVEFIPLLPRVIAPHDFQVRGHVELLINFLCACNRVALANSCMFCACGFCHVEFIPV